MALGIMFLDMLKLRRLLESRNVPIQVPHPLMQRWIPGPNVSDVAFEMLDVYGIEANNGGVEAYVRFGDVLAEVVGCGMFGEVLFSAVERDEEGIDGFFVGFLGSVLSVKLLMQGKSWKVRMCRVRTLRNLIYRRHC
jgi:hypothetical protein